MFSRWDREQLTRTGTVAYFAEFHDSRLYEWFRSVGLTPRKSLTLGRLDVPDTYLLSVIRGLLDGDGNILNKVYRADTKDRSEYYWEYLQTRFNSASRPHLEWLAARIETKVGLPGYLQEVKTRLARPNRRPMFELRYGKRASLVLLPLLYPDDEPCLERKRSIWRDYIDRHGLGVR